MDKASIPLSPVHPWQHFTSADPRVWSIKGRVARHRQVRVLEAITSLKQGHQLCDLAPKVRVAPGRMQEMEGRGETKPRASLLEATQRLCHRPARLPGLGKAGVGCRERRRGEGSPVSAPGRGDLCKLLTSERKSNPLSSKHLLETKHLGNVRRCSMYSP